VRFHTESERHTAELLPGGSFVHKSLVPLQDLPPGDYTMRVEARSRMGTRPSAFRELHFTVAEPPIERGPAAAPGPATTQSR
jgi:hypothetical protein